MSQATSAVAGASSDRARLSALLGGLRAGLMALFEQRSAAVRRRRNILQRRLLLGLELSWKIEEQVLLPALADAEPRWAAPLALAGQEIELLRDVSLLANRTIAANRDVALTVLEGLAAVHFDRIDEVLRRPGGDQVPWRELEREIRGLLGRWRAEIATDGDIEDEERDPVGLPPR